MRPNRSWRGSSGDRRTMVRYEMFRWQDLTGGGSRPQVGSRRLCVPNSMQLLAPTVAFAATLGRGISAVRFTATLATSLLAAGLRTVAVTAVAGLAQDHLAPAQLAIEQPTLETHPPTPPCKGAWDSQLPEIRQEPAPCADTASPCLSNPVYQSLRTMATARQSTELQVPAAVPGSAAHSREKGSSCTSPLSRRRVSRRASSADNGIGARAVM